MSELPEGWATAKMSDVTEYISRGKSPKYAAHSSLPVINQRAIRWFGIQEEYLKYIDPAQFDLWTPERFIRLGDVLWNSTGTGTLGRACLIKQQDLNPPKVVDSHVTIVRPFPSAIEPRYLFAWIRSPEIQDNIADLTTGSTNQIELSRTAVSALDVPIAPLNEQKRIADKLDRLLTRVDACRERCDRIPFILKRFRQSVLAAATSGELTESWREENNRSFEDWEGTTVGELIDGIEAGINVRCEERPPLPHEQGLVKISAVTWGAFNDNESKTLPRNRTAPESTRIEVGDFLISRANTLELVGACVIVEQVTRPVFLSDKVLRVVMNDNYKKWLLFWLRSRNGRSQIEELASGNQLSMRNLTQANLKSISVKLPNEDERSEIIRRAEMLFAYADRLEARYKTARAQVDRLTPALLEKAFQGELVPQDPNDEPASVLLERIRSELTTAKQSKSSDRAQRFRKVKSD